MPTITGRFPVPPPRVDQRWSLHGHALPAGWLVAIHLHLAGSMSGYVLPWSPEDGSLSGLSKPSRGPLALSAAFARL
jgi:hypothetical protein